MWTHWIDRRTWGLWAVGVAVVVSSIAPPLARAGAATVMAAVLGAMYAEFAVEHWPTPVPRGTPGVEAPDSGLDPGGLPDYVRW